MKQKVFLSVMPAPYGHQALHDAINAFPSVTQFGISIDPSTFAPVVSYIFDDSDEAVMAFVNANKEFEFELN
jgi:hypothetical protein